MHTSYLNGEWHHLPGLVHTVDPGPSFPNYLESYTVWAWALTVFSVLASIFLWPASSVRIQWCQRYPHLLKVFLVLTLKSSSMDCTACDPDSTNCISNCRSSYNVRANWQSDGGSAMCELGWDVVRVKTVSFGYDTNACDKTACSTCNTGFSKDYCKYIYNNYECGCYENHCFNCKDVNECETGNSCHTNASCSNTLGSFTCSCNTGYMGTGVECSDIDECAERTHDCDINAACKNTVGSFTCSCNPGFMLNGDACLPCQAGTFKDVYGSSGCIDCNAGTYNFLNGSMGCVECSAGTYMDVRGGTACVDCAAGKYMNVSGASACSNCPSSARYSSPRSTSDSVCTPSECFEQTLPPDFVCDVPSIRVRGCAGSLFNFEGSTLRLSTGDSVSDVISTCGGFFTWMCGMLGTRRSDVLDCDWYCELFSNGWAASLEAGCGVDEDCRKIGESAATLTPLPASLGRDSATYALYSSCAASALDVSAFAAAVDALLAPMAATSQPDASAPSSAPEIVQVEEPVAAPGWLGEAGCSDRGDCSVACFQV